MGLYKCVLFFFYPIGDYLYKNILKVWHRIYHIVFVSLSFSVILLVCDSNIL